MNKYLTLNDAPTPASKIMEGAREHKERIRAAKVSLACVAMSFMANPAFIYAAGLDDKIKTALETIQKALVGITIPLYGVVAVICLIMMVAGSGRKAEMAKDWLIRASIAAAAIMSVSLIMSFIEGIGK